MTEPSLPFLGKGLGRRVYDLGDGIVLKWAKRPIGVAQNRAEAKISRSDGSAWLARVLEISPDGRELVMEKVVPVESMDAVCQFFSVNRPWLLREVRELRDLVERHSIAWGDLGRAQNWGTRDGVPVLLDYGFTLSMLNNKVTLDPTCRSGTFR
jgi:hypothetical protein